MEQEIQIDKDSTLTYENAMKELDCIIGKIENGNTSLEETVILFERGAYLIDFCSKTFQQFEGKITIIKNNLEEVFDRDNL